MTPRQSFLLSGLEKAARIALDVSALMDHISVHLHSTVTRYNWVGFYLVDKETPRTLVLGPHAGSFTAADRIPFDQGLCGAAATTGETVVVNQVAGDMRYVAASDLVKSEIVVPVLAKNVLIGAIDINSYFAGTFTPDEQEFVEACAALTGRYIEKHS